MGNLSSGFRQSIGASIFLAALSTFGDWVWAEYIPKGEIVHGVVHGAVVFAAIGWVLGRAAGTAGAVRNAVIGLLICGVLISASFYPLYGWIGIASLFVTWMALWLATAALQRWLRGASETLGRALMRGVAAATLSGVAFYAISGIWTSPPPDGPNYLWHFLCWTFAFLPGFAALFLAQPHLNSKELT